MCELHFSELVFEKIKKKGAELSEIDGKRRRLNLTFLVIAFWLWRHDDDDAGV